MALWDRIKGAASRAIDFFSGPPATSPGMGPEEIYRPVDLPPPPEIPEPPRYYQEEEEPRYAVFDEPGFIQGYMTIDEWYDYTAPSGDYWTMREALEAAGIEWTEEQWDEWREDYESTTLAA